MMHIVAATFRVAKQRSRKLRYAMRGGYALAVAILLAATARAQAPIPIGDVVRSTPVSFEKDILPILRKSCLACHGVGDASGELILESPQTILKGGDTGPAAVPGKSGESLLLKLASHQEEPFMPPPDNDVSAPALTSQELGLIKLWIDAGAKGSEGGGVLSPQNWRPLPRGPNPIYSVAITPDGQFTACSRADQIFIYHTPTGQLITRLTDPALADASSDQRPGRAHLDLVQSLAFSKEGDLLASGGFRTVKLWRFPRDVQRLQIPATAAVAAMAVSPDRSLVALAAENAIQLITAADGKAKATLAGHAGPVTALQFSLDGQKLVSASKDKSVRLWSVADGAQVGRIDTPGEAASLAVFYREEPIAPPDANAQPPVEQQPPQMKKIEQLATGGGDNFIRLWSVPQELPQMLAGAAASPTAIAASADRQWLAAAGADGTVQLFNLPQRKLVRQWKAHEGLIRSMDLFVPPAPEAENEQPASLLATAGEDGQVRLWRLDAAAPPLAQWTPGLAPLRTLAFSPNGQQLATGAENGAATIWSVQVPPPRTLVSAEGGATSLSTISRDGKKLALAAQAGGRAAIVVRDLDSGKVVRTLLGHEAPITSLAFSADGAKLISGSEDKTARVWDLADEKFAEAARFGGHAGPVRGVALNSDATQALTGADDNTFKLWTVATGEELKNLAGHTAPIAFAAFTPNNQPVSASADRTIRVWNPADGAAVRTIDAQAAVTKAALSLDGTRLAAVGDDKSIRIFQFDNGAVLHTLAGHAEAPHSISFSLDNLRLATADRNRALAWSVADGRLLQVVPHAGLTSASFGAAADAMIMADAEGTIAVQSLRFSLALPGMTQAVTDLVYHPANQFIYAGCGDGTIRGYSPANGQQAFSASHGAAVHGLALSPDTQRLASAGEDKTIKLWNPGNGGQIQPPQLAGFVSPVRSVCFSADNARVIGGSATGEVLAYSTADGVLEELLAGHAQPVTSLLAGAESDALISSAEDVRFWKLAAVRRLAGHSQPVTALAALVDRPLEIVSGSADGTVRRWNTQNGQAIQQFNHGAAITSVAVRADGKRIASGGANNVAVLWNAENNQQIAQLKGDPRLQSILARVTQEKSDAVAKVASAKTILAAAEQELPAKTQAEQQAAAALATAEADVAAKATALASVTTTKTNAEKTAIEMAAAAQKAAAVMETANKKALELAAKAKLLAEDAAKAKSLADGAPMSTDFAKAYETAAMIAATADAEAKAADAAKAAPTQVAAQASQAAVQAAQAAEQTVPPFTQASEALTASQIVRRTALQAHAAAKRELEFATKAVPAAKEEVAAAEAALTKVDTTLAAAQDAAVKSEQPIRSVAFSPEGSVLAGGGDFGAIHTWDTETGRPIASYRGHAGPVQTLAYVSKDELVSGSADKSSIAWTLNPDWRLERTIGDVRDPSILVDRVLGVDFSPAGDLVAAAGGVPSRLGELKVFRVDTGEPVLSLPEAHTDAVNAVAFSPDGEFLATAGSDKYVKKFSVKNGEQLVQFEGHTNHVLDVAWRAGGKILASAGADSTINLWDAQTGDRPISIQGYLKQITSVRFQGQTQFLVVSSGDRLIRMHNADNGGVQRDFPGSADYMYSVDISADGGIVVAGGHDGVLRIWNGTNSQPMFSIASPEAK
jgi:WD40 repeat protein